MSININDEEVKRIAAFREKNLSTTRRLSKDFESVGITGELYFSEKTGIPIDHNRYLQGDNGIDFVIESLTIDVKTARKPHNLIVEENHVRARTYVLYGINETGDCYDVGWEWGKNVLTAPTKDFGHGVIDHYIPARSLIELQRLYKYIRIFTHKNTP